MTAPVLVIGGGVAGSAAATLLARAGRQVVLFDQHREPRHKMCGEFLSAEACESLARLGIDLPAAGALPVHTLRLARGRQCAQIELPFPAFSLTRKCLDAKMLDLARDAGVDLRLGTRIADLKAGARGNGERDRDRASSPVHLTTTHGSAVAGGAAFLASGKHDLYGHARAAAGKLVAFKQYFRLRAPAHRSLRESIELHLFRGGYAGLQLVETGEANLCLLVDQQRMRRLGGWTGVLQHVLGDAPQLRSRLAGSTAVLPQPLALSRIPYGYLTALNDDFWRVGDQAAVIPSFTGDGMAMALHSAQLAAHMYLRGATPLSYHHQLRDDFRHNMSRSGALARLLLTPGLRWLAVTAAVFMPQLLTRMAGATRIRSDAVQRLRALEIAEPADRSAYNEPE